MALQCNVSVRGGLTATAAYVRLKSLVATKVGNDWIGSVEWEVYKDAIEAAKAVNVRVSIPTSTIDRDKFALTLGVPNFVAQAYNWAKANKAEFAGATDV